jgi:hypothetical protein
MLPPGLSAKATSLRLRFGGFLTWAAKPSVRESPDPAIHIEFIPTRSPLTGRLLAPWHYVLPAVEVPFTVTSFMLLFGRRAHPSGSKILNSLHEADMEQTGHVL